MDSSSVVAERITALTAAYQRLCRDDADPGLCHWGWYLTRDLEHYRSYFREDNTVVSYTGPGYRNNGKAL